MNTDQLRSFLRHPSACRRGHAAMVGQDLPLVSVVMPSFNQARYIERSIRSVIAQRYRNIELIIIDGGSNDGTVDILREYNDFISFWVSERDSGQSDALNKGFAVASGEIFGWLNSDDLYAPGAIKRAVREFFLADSAQVVFGDWASIDKDDNVLTINYAFDFDLERFKYEGFHLNAQAMFWRSGVHRNWGGFDLSLYNTMDYQMILEFGINQGEETFRRIPRVLGCFRRYDGQKTGASDRSRVESEHKQLAIKHGYTDKYSWQGHMKRLWFRLGRLVWLLRRGGIRLLAARITQKLRQHGD